MHIIGIAEGYVDGIQRFKEYFNGKEYCKGKCKVRVRDITPLHFSLNECGYEEFLADLKAFTRYNHDVTFDPNNNFGHQLDTTSELHSKLAKYVRYIRKIFKMIKPIEKDLDNVKTSNIREELESKGLHFNSVFLPIGKVADWRRADGKEAV